ncbi:hypothetical protein H6P81_017964 [Aristolochia fimbriata]|uniref:Small auxin up regulated protein n=1 Tax=Aristolochia fimbriata TaxID=158543 RepID=A0AAV7DZM6_ARIFI|nr:hypothetical protein H6P81_017964 [Aristolochia fimbriata]
MINPKKLVGLVLRRNELSVMGKRRTKTHGRDEIIPDANKGYFVVYSNDGGRFGVPLEFLGSPLCKRLLRMSEDEFELYSNSPVVVRCEAGFIDNILSLF